MQSGWPAGIVAGRKAEHVFIGSGAQLREAVYLHRAGVGDKYDFSALQHQNSGAFGEFSVIADHGPYFNNAVCSVQLGYIKIVSGGQPAFLAKVAGMHLGVG